MLFPYNGQAKIYAECGGGNLANNKRVFVSSLYTLWQRAVLKPLKFAPQIHIPLLSVNLGACVSRKRVEAEL